MRDRHLKSRESRMKCREILLTGVAAFVAAVGLGASAWAATTVQVGPSGKTFASAAVQCLTNPVTGSAEPTVEAGLLTPKRTASADVSLNGEFTKTVTAADPVAYVWLDVGENTVVVALSRKTADSYSFTVNAGECVANTFSENDTLEYAASGKSYATVTPGCAMSPTTGQPQPYVHLFDNGGYLLNVSVNGVPLTQLSALKTHTPVFLSAGRNVISAANASLSIDYYVRDGGDGTCTLPQ